MFYHVFSTKINPGGLSIMAFPVVEFSREGYKNRKIFG
jgi:hypothetical protein